MNNTTTIKEAIAHALRAQRVSASLATKGIEFNTRSGYTVSGNTYTVRSILKAAGFRYWHHDAEWTRNDISVYRDVSPVELGATMLRELAR